MPQKIKTELTPVLSKLRRSPKFGGIYELYRKEMEPILRKATAEKLNKLWFAHLSKLDELRADKLTPLEFQHLILQSAFEDGHYYTVTILARVYGQICNFASAVAILRDNPAKTVNNLPLVKKAARLHEQARQHRPTLDYQHLRSQLKRVLRDFEGCCDRQRLLLEIQLRTILRPGEAVKLKISDLDLRQHILTVRQTKTKEIFLIPTTESLELCLIAAYSSFGCSEGWIFAGVRDHKKHLSSQTLNKALKDNGYRDLLCAHGLRSVAANFFARNERKVPPYVAEACLQHSCPNASVVKAYRRDDYLRSRKTAMRLWDSWIDGIYAEIRQGKK